MVSDLTTSIETWVKSLPSSRMVFPETYFDRIKYLFWRFYTPYHPYLRDALIWLGVVSHEGRQDYLLGKIAPGQTIEEFVAFLITKGFGNHFVAWKDEGEVVSLRLVRDFVFQYHLRVFEDGEIRAHYEYTPECRPILHMRGVDMQGRRNDFLNILGDKIISGDA